MDKPYLTIMKDWICIGHLVKVVVDLGDHLTYRTYNKICIGCTQSYPTNISSLGDKRATVIILHQIVLCYRRKHFPTNRWDCKYFLILIENILSRDSEQTEIEDSMNDCKMFLISQPCTRPEQLSPLQFSLI